MRDDLVEVRTSRLVNVELTDSLSGFDPVNIVITVLLVLLDLGLSLVETLLDTLAVVVTLRNGEAVLAATTPEALPTTTSGASIVTLDAVLEASRARVDSPLPSAGPNLVHDLQKVNKYSPNT